MVELKCLRCGKSMQHIDHTKLQLGQTGWIMGDIPNLIAGALEVDIFCCPACGKLEFFRTDYFNGAIFPNQHVVSDLPQRTCPECGVQHDFDYPKCPVCGYDYYK